MEEQSKPEAWDKWDGSAATGRCCLACELHTWDS